MKTGQAIKHALDGDAILFIGSGFSFGAKNTEGSEFLSGQQLANYLCGEIKTDEKLSLDMAAEIYIDKQGTSKIIEKLKKLYVAIEVHSDHVEVASLPWRRVYTTNYDNVFEIASLKAKKRVIPLTLSNTAKNYIDKERFCLHINGFIDELTTDSLFKNFKLTKTSYLTEDFNNSKWSTLFRQDINLAKAVIFIGYSLYDIDITRILYNTDAIKDKCIFVVGDNPSLAEQYTIRQIGRLSIGGLSKFSTSLCEIRAAYKPKEHSLFLKSFEEFNLFQEEKLTDDKIYDLFLRGEVSSNLIFLTIRSSTENDYVVKRQIAEDISIKIDAGHNIFLIHGDLGNGKSVIVEQVKCIAKQKNIRVFSLKQYPNFAESDLQKIFTEKDKCLIIIENYSRHIKILEYISLRKLENFIFIFTDRSSLNEYYAEEFTSFFDKKSYIEYDCNKLNANEISNIIRLINRTGLWKDKASLSAQQKEKLIKIELKSELQSILIEIINSPEIKKRLMNLLSTIHPDGKIYKIILLALVLRTLDYEPSTSTISELLKIPSIKKEVDQYKLELREILSISGNSIIIKSSVIARFLLSNFLSKNSAFLIEILIETYKACEEIKEIDNTYKSLQKDLRRYSVLQSILPMENRRSLLINYYEEIKNLESSLHNPFFWVQYGIARLAFHDFEISESCFKTAYGIGSRFHHFDEYQIDNHYARLLLERSTYEPEKHNQISDFREANALLSKQMSTASQNKHYPYRIASLYKGFLEKNFEILTVEDLKLILHASQVVLKKILQLPEIYIKNNYVSNCKENMLFIINTIKPLVT